MTTSPRTAECMLRLPFLKLLFVQRNRRETTPWPWAPSSQNQSDLLPGRLDFPPLPSPALLRYVRPLPTQQNATVGWRGRRRMEGRCRRNAGPDWGDGGILQHRGARQVVAKMDPSALQLLLYQVTTWLTSFECHTRLRLHVSFCGSCGIVKGLYGILLAYPLARISIRIIL